MKKLLLLSLLIGSVVFMPSVQSEPKLSDLSFEWVEDFDLGDNLEIKEKSDQERSFDDDFDFLAEVDFNLDDLEVGEPPERKKTDEEEVQFVLFEGPIDSEHTIAEVDFDLEEITVEEPIESDIIFSSSGISHKASFLQEAEEVAIVEIKKEPLVVKRNLTPTDLVTNRQYSEFVKSAGHKPPSHWSGKQPPIGTENHAVVNVSYKDAYLYVVWAGKRLPTDAELRIAEVSDGPRVDSDEVIGEWTASAASLNKVVKQRFKGGHIGAQLTPGHLIFTSKEDDSIALENTKVNSSIGFRSVNK